jgi:hypothetical protein
MSLLAWKVLDADGGYGYEVLVHLYCVPLLDRHSTASDRAGLLDAWGSHQGDSAGIAGQGDECELA